MVIRRQIRGTSAVTGLLIASVAGFMLMPTAYVSPACTRAIEFLDAAGHEPVPRVGAGWVGSGVGR